MKDRAIDDRALRLALEALLDEPTLKSTHRASIERGLADLRAQRLTPDERDYLRYLIEHYTGSTPLSPDPVAALIAAFQHKLPNHDPAAVATAIHALVAGDAAQLDGKSLALTIEQRGQTQIANLAERNVVMGDLNQLDISVHIPIFDARFDTLLATAIKTHEQEKTLARIQHAAQQIESDRLLNLRLQGFVGRVNELAAIREMIETMRPAGGYVLIKALAGEGKSSIIAKLIQDAGIAATPHHFIALNTDSTYQIGLLRTLVAQLILKYDLSTAFFPETNYPAMKALLVNILDDISKNGLHETIYIDGLDQLPPEDDGSRDLSFLPLQPSPGIVIILGSRPDETLRPLSGLHKIDFHLPILSEDDAIMMWKKHQSNFSEFLLKKLYYALRGNALYISIVDKELSNTININIEEIISIIQDDPNNLFSISINRIKYRNIFFWNTHIRPLLSLLMVSMDAIPIDALVDLMKINIDHLSSIINILGGLVSQSIDKKVFLHHLKFYDYLKNNIFSDNDINESNKHLAKWCSGYIEGYTKNEYKKYYYHRNYIKHLVLSSQWNSIWSLIYKNQYIKEKFEFDPSKSIYIKDINYIFNNINILELDIKDISNILINLWKCKFIEIKVVKNIKSLPALSFKSLILFNRIPEALNKLEIIHDPLYVCNILIDILRIVPEYYELQIIWRLQNIILQINDNSIRNEIIINIISFYMEINKEKYAINFLKEYIVSDFVFNRSIYLIISLFKNGDKMIILNKINSISNTKIRNTLIKSYCFYIIRNKYDITTISYLFSLITNNEYRDYILMELSVRSAKLNDINEINELTQSIDSHLIYIETISSIIPIIHQKDKNLAETYLNQLIDFTNKIGKDMSLGLEIIAGHIWEQYTEKSINILKSIDNIKKQKIDYIESYNKSLLFLIINLSRNNYIDESEYLLRFISDDLVKIYSYISIIESYSRIGEIFKAVKIMKSCLPVNKYSYVLKGIILNGLLNDSIKLISIANKIKDKDIKEEVFMEIINVYSNKNQFLKSIDLIKNIESNEVYRKSISNIFHKMNNLYFFDINLIKLIISNTKPHNINILFYELSIFASFYRDIHILDSIKSVILHKEHKIQFLLGIIEYDRNLDTEIIHYIYINTINCYNIENRYIINLIRLIFIINNPKIAIDIIKTIKYLQRHGFWNNKSILS